MFRADGLNRESNESGKLIGRTVVHQKPKVLEHLQVMQSQPFSSTQKEIALLLAPVVASEKIGQPLHVNLSRFC
jgi:hypothetical protein